MRCAAAESDWSRVVWQVGHMTCPSRDVSEVRGCAQAAAGRRQNERRHEHRDDAQDHPESAAWTPRWNASF